MRLHKTCTTLTLAIALSLSVIAPAHAYIDMGTGSLIFQMLVAGIVGAGFTIKMYWHALKNRVNRLLGRPVEDDILKSEDASATVETHAGRDSKG